MVAKHSWLAILALCMLPPASLAQYVFFDDFDGNDLLPHWLPPPSNYWEYNVSNGMLNVTGLFHPGVGSNHAVLWTHFEHQTDFRVDVWMGWQAGDAPHRLALRVLGPFPAGPVIAQVGYRNQGTGPELFASAANQAVFLPAPASSFHQLTVSRSGRQFAFLLDGSPVASFSSQHDIVAGGINIEFLGSTTGHFGTFHIDRIQVIPAPGTWLVAVLLTAISARRRRVAKHPRTQDASEVRL